MGLARLGICLPIHDEAIGMWVGGEVLACVQGEHVGLWERWPDAMVARMQVHGIPRVEMNAYLNDSTHGFHSCCRGRALHIYCFVNP